MNPNLAKLQAYPFERLRSVVVSGNLPSADGKYSQYCAVIVKRVDDSTKEKTSINELLRPAGLSRGPLKGEKLCLQ